MLFFFYHSTSGVPEKNFKMQRRIQKNKPSVSLIQRTVYHHLQPDPKKQPNLKRQHSHNMHHYFVLAKKKKSFTKRRTRTRNTIFCFAKWWQTTNSPRRIAGLRRLTRILCIAILLVRIGMFLLFAHASKITLHDAPHIRCLLFHNLHQVAIRAISTEQRKNRAIAYRLTTKTGQRKKKRHS